MDAKQLGTFIAERRKELGLTQVALAEKLHVTDKAISKWERGVGLPDIHSLEALAEGLEVSVLELMQAKKSEEEKISKVEVEEVLLDTIQLSKTRDKIIKNSGCIILAGFGCISVLLLWLLITSSNSGTIFSVGSIITGLIAWGIPIWQISFARVKRTVIYLLSSLGFAVTSLVIQFLGIEHEVITGDWSAIEDTIHALNIVILLFCAITLLLNIIMIVLSRYKRNI